MRSLGAVAFLSPVAASLMIIKSASVACVELLRSFMGWIVRCLCSLLDIYWLLATEGIRDWTTYSLVLVPVARKSYWYDADQMEVFLDLSALG